MASSISFDSFHNIIDGKPRSADAFTHGIDPATGQKLWDVPVGTQKDVDDAVVAAGKAFQVWKKTSMEERKAALLKWRDVYKSHFAEMQKLLSMENGKIVCLALL